MRTTFGRQFAVNAGLILLSFIILGVSFVSLLFNYFVDQQRDSLLSSARAIADLGAAYSTMGNLEEDANFRMSLSITAEVAGADVQICTVSGRVLLCSDDAIFCEHTGQSLPEDIVSTALSEGECWNIGSVEGLYDSKRYLAAVPMVSDDSGAQLGLVVVSADAGVLSSLLGQLSNNYIFSAVVVLLVAMIVSSFLTRSQTRSMREMAEAVSQYGHGDFDIRLQPDKQSTEEMAELARAFNTMAESLAVSEQRRTEFVANVSHELKTPMTTIGGFVDGMLDGTIPPERHRQYLQAVSDEVRRLSRLVRSMLEVSRLQSQGVQENKKTKFDICESLGRALLTFEQKINAKHLDVEVEFPDKDVNVLAEKDSITQVLYNLVDNAVKFCPENGKILLKVEPSGGKARISVANTGETIPEQELQLIFDRFHKTDKSRSMDKDGVGLGLYIVRTILASHNEDVTVTSRDGVTTFQFGLPLAK